jgi:hypothetical protein
MENERVKRRTNSQTADVHIIVTGFDEAAQGNHTDSNEQIATEEPGQYA